MKCLSIQQPWAQYIAAGIKDIENRPWGLKNFPQRVLIHTGKKKMLESFDKQPLLYQLIIENAEHLGIVPLIEDMPTGAIIGVVDIVGCSVNDVEFSDWAGFSDDPEHPVYNLHLANARLFKDPILDVKGKQGIFEYAEINEDNMPETVDIPSIRREGKELFIPVDADEVEDYADMDGEGLTFDYNLLNNNLELFAEIVDEDIQPLPTDYINFFNGSRSVRVKVIDTEISFITDEDGNEIEFCNPAGDILSWAKVFYTIVPEKSRKKKGSGKSAKQSLNDVLAKSPETCRNIITAIELAGYTYQYHREPDSEYAAISTEIDVQTDARLDADFMVNLETGVVTLTLYTEDRVPMKSIKKAIETANIINSSAVPGWLIINPENGAIIARVCNICSESPLTVNEAGSMIAYAIQTIESNLSLLII